MLIKKVVHTYKVINNHEIKADSYSLNDDTLHPVIIWIHGGALILGNREIIPSEQVEMYVKAGFTVVSVDYRLAPETKLANIVEDIQDAYNWVREKGPELFNIDPNRVGIIGQSGGGYLALMTGFCVDPRPSALVSFYGYGDISGAWYSRPDKFYCKQPVVSKEEAYKAVGGSVISSTPIQSDRGLFYLYCRQNGLWPKEVTGHDPDTDDDYFDSFCPIRNVSKEYPPTLLLHGTADTDVPYDQSVMMANELARVGTTHELFTIPDGGHVFDFVGLGEPKVANAFSHVLTFLEQHTR